MAQEHDPRHTERYIVWFKPKDLRTNQKDDKLNIVASVCRMGDIRNYTNMSEVRLGDKYHRWAKSKTGRNESDDFVPIMPAPDTIHDINRYSLPIITANLNEEQYHRMRKDPNII